MWYTKYINIINFIAILHIYVRSFIINNTLSDKQSSKYINIINFIVILYIYVRSFIINNTLSDMQSTKYINNMNFIVILHIYVRNFIINNTHCFTNCAILKNKKRSWLLNIVSFLSLISFFNDTNTFLFW